jgi:hypothetical protein
MTRLVWALGVVGATAACGLSSSQIQLRTAAANECFRQDAAHQPSCFSHLAPLTDDEPAACAYYLDSQGGWVAAVFLPKGTALWTPGRQVDPGSLSTDVNNTFQSPDVHAASRGCLVEMSRALAAGTEADQKAAQAALEREHQTAVERAKAAALAEAAAKMAARQGDLLRQFAPVIEECKAKWLSLSSKCVDIAGLSDDERMQCQRSCADEGARGYKDALAGAQAICVLATTPPKCKLPKPAGAFVDDARLKSDLAACSLACRDDRKAAAEAAKAHRLGDHR